LGFVKKTIEKQGIQQHSTERRCCIKGKNTFNSINGLDSLKSLPGFVEFKLLINPGELVPQLKDFSGRIAYSIFTASTYEKLNLILGTAKSVLSFS
jgi:hypothetical protein